MKDEKKEELYQVSTDNNQEITHNVVNEIARIIIALIILGILFNLLIISKNNTTRIGLLPFILCLMCNLGALTSSVLGKENLVNIFNKGYLVVFLLCWFSFLIFWTYNVIKNGNNISLLVFSIPFWIIGIIVVYEFFIKK